MYYCKNNCNRLCPRFIISTAVTVVTIDGTDTLVIDIPAGTYQNCEKYCIVVAQAIPATATTTMPVAVSIGGDTTTVYPLVCYKNCLQAVACQVRARAKYVTVVQTNTTSGVFKVLHGLGAYCPDVLNSLPIADTAAAGTFSLRATETPTKTTKVITNTKKEVISHE